MAPPKDKRCAVLVFGDIGRSPRMQNHALQLAECKQYTTVYLIGYNENKPYESVVKNPRIKIVPISTGLVDLLRKLPSQLYFLYALLRVLIQVLQLVWTLLFSVRRCDFVLVQNPPAVPALHVTYYISRLKRMKFVVDMHNYGFTILELANRSARVVSLARWYERYFVKKAQKVLCVSKSMQKRLKDEWGVDAVVVYDRPNTDIFKAISIDAKHNFFMRNGLSDKGGTTLFTQPKQVVAGSDNMQFERKTDSPVLLVSSTSWTKDEDFGILLRALEKYETRATLKENEESKYASIVLVITGKGPEKARYEAEIAQKQTTWRKVSVFTRWLAADDYPLMLASADLGVCLHKSSSAVDLPMKVVDMFGAGLPVLAINYASIGELVANNVTGRIFNDETELSEILHELFYEWPRNKELINRYRYNVFMARQRDFNAEWRENALPAIQSIK